MTVPAPQSEGRSDLLEFGIVGGIILIASIVILGPSIPHLDRLLTEFLSGPYFPGAGLLAVRAAYRRRSV